MTSKFDWEAFAKFIGGSISGAARHESDEEIVIIDMTWTRGGTRYYQELAFTEPMAKKLMRSVARKSRL